MMNRVASIVIEKDWVDILSSLGVVVVGCIAAYIAFRQYKNDSTRLKLDVYDKRFEVYRAIREFISGIFQNGNVTYKEISQFQVRSAQAEFLLDEEINKKIEELRSKGLRLHYVEDRLNNSNLPVGEERTKLAEESGELLTWFDEESKKMTKLFVKHLKVD